MCSTRAVKIRTMTSRIIPEKADFRKSMPENACFFKRKILCFFYIQ